MGKWSACFRKCACISEKDRDSVDVAQSTSNTGPLNWSATSTTDNDPATKSSTEFSTEGHKINWTSGARREVTLINWKVQDFHALCELKDLLRSETCIFTAGHTLNQPSRWCFNLQRMKNEDNIGLFLKRMPTLTFHQATGLTEKQTDDDLNGNSTKSEEGSVTDQTGESESNNDDPVYIYYECTIKRSGTGEPWIQKRTCIPNFEIDQRLGFRKLFTMEELKAADDGKSKTPPLLGEDNTLFLEIRFTVHLKSLERTQSEVALMDKFSTDRARRYHCGILVNEFKKLLNSGTNADTTIILEPPEESEETKYSAHRGILSARSPVFAAMFASGMTESQLGTVRIKDVTPKAMQTLLSYMYTGSTEDTLSWKSVRDIEDVIYAADKYAIAGLRDFIDKMMYTGCNNDNAMELLYLAQLHSLKVAIKEISVFIKMNANQIFRTC